PRLAQAGLGSGRAVRLDSRVHEIPSESPNYILTTAAMACSSVYVMATRCGTRVACLIRYLSPPTKYPGAFPPAQGASWAIENTSRQVYCSHVAGEWRPGQDHAIQSPNGGEMRKLLFAVLAVPAAAAAAILPATAAQANLTTTIHINDQPI